GAVAVATAADHVVEEQAGLREVAAKGGLVRLLEQRLQLALELAGQGLCGHEAAAGLFVPGILQQEAAEEERGLARTRGLEEAPGLARHALRPLPGVLVHRAHYRKKPSGRFKIRGRDAA